MKLDVTGKLVCRTVEGTDNALETILNTSFRRDICVKRDLERTVIVVPEALIIPKFCQNGHNRGKHM